MGRVERPVEVSVVSDLWRVSMDVLLFFVFFGIPVV